MLIASRNLSIPLTVDRIGKEYAGLPIRERIEDRASSTRYEILAPCFEEPFSKEGGTLRILNQNP